MALREFLLGREGGLEQVPTMAPEQQALLRQLTGGIGAPLGAGLQQLQTLLTGGTQAFEKPLMRQFREEIVPGIAERFAGLGAGAQQSSAFRQALGRAGAGLTERLGALRGGLQQQALGQLTSLLGAGLGARPFETVYRPATTGFLGAIAPGVGSALGTAATGGLSSLLGIL